MPTAYSNYDFVFVFGKTGSNNTEMKYDYSQKGVMKLGPRKIKDRSKILNLVCLFLSEDK